MTPVIKPKLALLMSIIIARGFLKETWFDRLLIVLAAIMGIAIALFLSFLQVASSNIIHLY